MTLKQIEAMKMAFEALEYALNKPMWNRPKMTVAITALEEALAQPEQEPVVHDPLPRACNLAGVDYQTFLKIKAYMPVAPPQPEQEPVAWPCLIDSADFSENTITLVMQCDDYKVSAGTHWLSTTQPQRTEQEPVGTVKDLFTQAAWERLDLRGSTKVYLAVPPQSKWVGLTRRERFEIEKAMSKYYDYQHECKTVCLPEFAAAIEAKLKQKNGYAEEKNT